jgi:hypothetical protein
MTDENTPYEAPSVEDIGDGYPISTVAGLSSPPR